MLNSLTITLVALTLLLPLVTGIYAYTRTSHHLFLQIPFVVVFVPITTGVLVVSLFELDGGVAPRWFWRLPQILIVVCWSTPSGAWNGASHDHRLGVIAVDGAVLLADRRAALLLRARLQTFRAGRLSGAGSCSGRRPVRWAADHLAAA